MISGHNLLLPNLCFRKLEYTRETLVSFKKQLEENAKATKAGDSGGGFGGFGGFGGPGPDKKTVSQPS